MGLGVVCYKRFFLVTKPLKGGTWITKKVQGGITAGKYNTHDPTYPVNFPARPPKNVKSHRASKQARTVL